MADYAITAVERRVVYSGSAGTGPYNFNFPVLAATDIKVYQNATLKTLTTHYTVSISGVNGTGSVTLGSAASGSDTITIVGARSIQRSSDFVTAGDLLASSLNEELDSLTIFTQQVSEEADRSIKAPVTDPTDIEMTLPAKADRKGKFLAFNTTSGNPEAGATISAVNSLSDITDEINTLAGISANVTTVAGISANVTTVAGVSGNVSTVAGISSNVTAVAGDATDIGVVAGKATEIGRLGTSAAATALTTLGTSAAVADMNALEAISGNITTVAGAASNVTTVAGISSNVTTVAGIAANVTAVAGDATDIGAVAGKATEIGRLGTAAAVADLVGTTDFVTDLNIVASADFVSDLNTVASADFVSDLNDVAAVTANVTTVANNIAGVNSFADRYRVASSDPASSLDEGDLVYNSTSNTLKYYNGSAWVTVAAPDVTAAEATATSVAMAIALG